MTTGNVGDECAYKINKETLTVSEKSSKYGGAPSALVVYNEYAYFAGGTAKYICTTGQKSPVLMANMQNERVWYEYEDIPKNDELEELRELIADLYELVLFGGEVQ